MQNVNKLIDNKVTEQRAYLEEKLAAQAKETADRIEMLKQKNDPTSKLSQTQSVS